MSPLEIVIFLPIVAALAIWLGAPARMAFASTFAVSRRLRAIIRTFPIRG